MSITWLTSAQAVAEVSEPLVDAPEWRTSSTERRVNPAVLQLARHSTTVTTPTQSSEASRRSRRMTSEAPEDPRSPVANGSRVRRA